MDKNEKAALDAYRQERKERIAKQTKSNAKKGHSNPAAKSAAGKVFGVVVSIVVVIALLAGILSFFAVPQKLTKAVVIDGEGYSMSELSCYYMQMYNNVYQTAASYDQNYGEGYGKMLTGYDVTVSPADQKTKDADGNEITWDEQFLNQAIDTMANIKRYYKAAVEAGVELTDEAETQINETLESYKTYLGNYSLSNFLQMQYGKGVNEALFKKILNEQQLVSIYQEQIQDELKAAYSADDVNEIYSKDKAKYDVVGFRWFTIDVAETKDAEKTSGAEDTSEVATEKKPVAEELEAQKFIDTVKAEANYSEETFKKVVLQFADKEDEAYDEYKQDAATLLQKITKDSIETNVSKDAANWLYETNDAGNYVRQAGDMKYFLAQDGKAVYIIYATGTPYRDETKHTSVRHILVKFPEATTEAVSGEAVSGEAEEATLSADVKAECESEAASILASYNEYIKENTSDVADEQYFGELASKLSDDTGSKSTGGLIEHMANDGQYVPEFEDWAFCEGDYEGETRTAGSTGIIETDYGYHVMYFVGAEENPDWYESILSDLITEDWEAKQTEFDDQFGEDAIERKEKIEKKVKESCLEMIDTSINASHAGHNH